MKETAIVNVLNEEEVQAWKAKHGKVFKTIIEGETYVWRKLKRKEYTKLMEKNEELETDNSLFEKQESITEMCLLFPSNVKKAIEDNAGLATTMSDIILKKSGFDIISETEEL